LLSWCERKDKLLGLYSNRIELSGPGGRPVQIESEDDLSLLDEAELQQLERLKAKMQRLPAPPEPEPIVSVIMPPWGHALAAPKPTDASVVAVVEDTSIGAQAKHLHGQGLSARDIANPLGADAHRIDRSTVAQFHGTRIMNNLRHPANFRRIPLVRRDPRQHVELHVHPARAVITVVQPVDSITRRKKRARVLNPTLCVASHKRTGRIP